MLNNVTAFIETLVKQHEVNCHYFKRSDVYKNFEIVTTPFIVLNENIATDDNKFSAVFDVIVHRVTKAVNCDKVLVVRFTERNFALMTYHTRKPLQ